MRTLVSLLGAATAVRSLSMPSSTAERRTILVTGSTDGIGKFTAGKLAADGHDVLVHGRSAERVQDTVEQLRRRAPAGATIEGYVADLSDMAQVRALAREIMAARPALDALANNAGTFDGDYTGTRKVRPIHDEDTLAPYPTPGPAAAPQVTDAGHEYSLAVNVMAPFLLTSLLLPALRASPGGARVLVTSSISMGAGDALDDLQCARRWSGHRAYSLSKLCDAMLALEMHARYGDAPRLCFNTMDPGTVDTKMLNAGWGSGAPVSTATRTYEMLTRPEWGERSGVCTCGTDREVNDPELRRKLWDDLVALTGAEWPDA